MLAIALVSFTLQDSHARLHPPDTDWFVEIPNVAALVDAYDATPILRLIQDEELRASVSELTGKFEEQLEQGFEQVAQLSGFTREDVENAPAIAADWLRQVDTVSLSLSGYRTAYSSLADVRAKWFEAERELDELAAAVRTSLSAGHRPMTLEEVDVAAETRTDPWGRPYTYKPMFDLGDGLVEALPEGSEVSATQPFGIYCHGPENVPGSLFAGDGVDLVEGSKSVSAEANIELFGESLTSQFGLYVALDFKTPEAAQELHTRLLELAESSHTGSDSIGAVAVDRFENGTETPAWLARTGSSLLLGVAGVEAAESLQRLDGSTAGLDQSPKYVDFSKAVAERAGSSGHSVLRGYHEVGLLELLFDLGTLQAAPDELGPLEQFQTRTAGAFDKRLDQGRFIVTALERRAEESPTDALIGAASISAAQFALVPSDAIAVGASSVDLDGIYTVARGMLSDSDGAAALAEVDEELAELRETWGIDVVGDLVGSLGQEVTAYLQPLKIGVPNCALVWELVDEEAMGRFVLALSDSVEEMTEGAFTFASRKYKKQLIWTLRRGSGPLPAGDLGNVLEQAFSQLTPSITLVDGHAVFCLTSLHAKRTIKRVLDEDRELHPMGTSLAIPTGAASGYFVDWAGMILDLYTIGRGALGMLGGMTGAEVPFKASDLPDPGLIEPYFEPTVGWVSKGPEGTWTTSQSSFGPETWVVLAAAVGGSAAWTTAGVKEQLDSANESVARIDVANLTSAVNTFTINNAGRWPETLDDLVVPDENGQTYLDATEVPTDPWGNPYRYEVLKDEAKMRVWSVGPNGLDEDGGGDDVVRTRRARSE